MYQKWQVCQGALSAECPEEGVGSEAGRGGLVSKGQTLEAI